LRIAFLCSLVHRVFCVLLRRVLTRLDPVLVNVPPASDVKMSCVSFARNSDCLLVGDSGGLASVFQLRGTTPPPENQVRLSVCRIRIHLCVKTASIDDTTVCECHTAQGQGVSVCAVSSRCPVSLSLPAHCAPHR